MYQTQQGPQMGYRPQQFGPQQTVGGYYPAQTNGMTDMMGMMMPMIMMFLMIGLLMPMMKGITGKE